MPAARAAAEAAGDSASFEEVLRTCNEAAAQGAENTRAMIAKKGRASYLGTASQGVVDPGAILVSWIFGGTGQIKDFTGE